jgi:hypothetical protein
MINQDEHEHVTSLITDFLSIKIKMVQPDKIHHLFGTKRFLSNQPSVLARWFYETFYPVVHTPISVQYPYSFFLFEVSGQLIGKASVTFF